MGLSDRFEHLRTQALFRRRDGLLDDPDQRRVERLVQRLRWLAILSWVWLIQGIRIPVDTGTLYTVYAGTLVYAVLCDAAVRYSSRIAVVSILTTLGDTLAIAAMCWVSGGISSPVYPVFFLSVLATTIRFGIGEAFAIATLDALHTSLLYALVGNVPLFSLAENVFYLYFVALLGGLLSGEARRQHERAVAERKRASLLLSLNRKIIASSDREVLLSQILQEMLGGISARGACVILKERGRCVGPAITAGRITTPSLEDAEPLTASAAAGDAETAGHVRLVGAEEIERRTSSAWLRAEQPSQVVMATIRAGDSLGLLVVLFDETSPGPSEEEIRLLAAVADETAVAIQKARLGTALVEAEARSRELLHRMIGAQEEERRRIAGELHDRMGKRFFEFYYDVRLLEGMSINRDSSSSEILTRIIESARECAGEIRTLMNDLRPSVLDDFGFLEALKEFATTLTARGELELSLAIDDAAPSGGPEVDLMLLRVLQEAVFNARKHAAAKRVQVEFGMVGDRMLRLVVRDDGCGFDLDGASPGHYGLLYMKERAEACGADFEVRSAPEKGTEVEVRVPIEGRA